MCCSHPLRMGNNWLGVWSWKRLELMVTGSSVEQLVCSRKLYLEFCRLQESAVFSCGAEDSRSARGFLRSPSTLDRLYSWLLWALHHQRGQEGNKAVQSSLYVFSFNSGSPGDFHYTRDRCLYQFTFSFYMPEWSDASAAKRSRRHLCGS